MWSTRKNEWCDNFMIKSCTHFGYFWKLEYGT